MNSKFKSKIKKSKQDDNNEYYKKIGEKIKKRRLELELTQEDIARGICSNTYVSKIENNKVIPKPEQLTMIMERIEMNYDEITLHPELESLLNKSFLAFFYKDIVKYKAIFDKIHDYTFSSEVYIIKFGYYLLIEDYDQARILNNELNRYVKDTDRVEINIYILYSAYFDIGVHNYKRAKDTLVNSRNHIVGDETYECLYNFALYIVNGYLHSLYVIDKYFDSVSKYLLKEVNKVRLTELIMYRSLFQIYYGSTVDIKFDIEELNKLSDSQVNFFILNLMFATSDYKYCKHIRPNKKYYTYSIFIRAYIHYIEKDDEQYKKYLNLLEKKEFELHSDLDFYNFLKAIESDNRINMKEHLVNFILPYLTDNQNIYFIEYCTEVLTKILAGKKRYKDTRLYTEKYKKIVEDLKSTGNKKMVRQPF